MEAPGHVTAAIEAAFGILEHPGDAFIVDSPYGGEAAEVGEAFAGRHDWRTLSAEFLDLNYVSLSFFTPAGLRFYLPAYMTADAARLLQTADPVFPLVYQLSDWAVEQHVAGERFEGRHGANVLVNPRRYGAMTNGDYARYRLSVFAREEAVAIVTYLEWRREADEYDRADIDQALDAYWRARTASAPTQADLARHLAEQARYMAALERRRSGPDSTA